MALDHFFDWLSQQGNLPNRLTEGMGALVKRARLEAGFSQRELAGRIYRRQAALSDIENGKMRMDVETLAYLAVNLDKSILYFFPDELVTYEVGSEQISDQERKLILAFRSLDQSDRDRVLKVASKLVEVESYIKEQIDNSIQNRVEFVGGSLEELAEGNSASEGTGDPDTP